MKFSHYSIGVDIGSVSVKVAILDRSGSIVKTAYRRFHGRPYQTLKALLDAEFSEFADETITLGFTGIGARTGMKILGGDSFGEIAAIAAANFEYCPEEIGRAHV